MGDGLSVSDAQWSGGVGVWVLCVCVCLCLCVRAIFSTLPPMSPPSSPRSAILLLPFAHTRSPLPLFTPSPLSWSPFCLDEKILILMALRLFSFFFFATQQWCDGLSYMPHGCSLLIGALSRHIYTRTLHMLLHTHTHTHTHSHSLRRSRAWFHLVFRLSPPLPPPWLLSTSLHTGNAVTVPPSSPYTALCFLLAILLSPILWCVAVHGISMLETLWGRGLHRRRTGMGVDDINGFFFPLLPNKHPVIMIQFNHPCNICLRHTGGRLPGESGVWTGLPLGRFDAWTIETQIPAPPSPHTHVHAPTQRPPRNLRSDIIRESESWVGQRHHSSLSTNHDNPGRFCRAL